MSLDPHGPPEDYGRRLAAAWGSPAWTTELPLRLLAAFALSLPADGAALLLAADTSHLMLQTLCASPGLASEVEALQLVVGECPASRAFQDGEPVMVQELGRPDERWPAFTAEVADYRSCTMVALPLDVGRLRIGVLDLYRRESQPVTAADLAAARRAGNVLAEGLLDITTAVLAGDDRQPWSDPGGAVVALSQASGVVSAQLRVPSEEATVRLRAHAFGTCRRLADVVNDVLLGTLLLER